MAITLTDLRTVIDQADSVTGWVNINVLGTTDPVPIETTGWIGANVGSEIFVGYHTLAAPTNLSNAVIYCWVFSRLSLGDTTDTNGGLMVMVGDGTDRVGYKTNGADKAAFRHDTGPTGWQCPALDTTSLPASPYVDAGAATPTWASITQVGTIVNSLVSAPGMNPTYNVDIMRYLLPANNNGCAADIIGGTSGTPGLWSEIAATDRLTGNLQAHGLVRELAAGAFGVQGPLRFGNATGTASSWFEDSNVTVVFEDRGFRTDLYKIFITDNGTGTTTFRLHGSALIAPDGVGAEFDADTDTDVTDVVIDNGSRIAGFIGGVGLQAGHIVTDTVITNSGQVRAGGATMNGSSVLLSTVALNTSALLWNPATDPDGLLDGMSFSKGAAAHHAIEFGVSSPLDITINNAEFTGFSATQDVNDSTFHIKRTTGTVTINIIGGSSDVSLANSYRTDGATVLIVQNPVTTSITCVDVTTGTALENVMVYLVAAAGGPLAINTVVIDKDLTTAAGLATDTRTIASNQPVVGKARRASVAFGDFYKTSPITGTINSASGLTITVQMIPDS
jgi:hypothetical protein